MGIKKSISFSTKPGFNSLQFSYELLTPPDDENRCIQTIVSFGSVVGEQLRKRILSNRLLMY